MVRIIKSCRVGGKMIRYFDRNLKEVEVKDRDKAIYGIDFENKEIELFNFQLDESNEESAYPIISFDEVEKLKKMIEDK